MSIQGRPKALWSYALVSMLLLLVILAARPAAAQADFRRGDVNTDGYVDLGDLYLPLFLTGFGPPCPDAADLDDSGVINITDAVWLLNYLFVGGPEPPAPGPFTPGPDPTPDSLPCPTYDPSAVPHLADFTLGIDCAPLTVTPGTTFRHEAIATLGSAAENLNVAQGWAISIALEGGGLEIVDATTSGTVAAREPEGLVGNGFELTEVVNPLLDTGAGPQGQGVVSSVILSFLSYTGLDPGSVEPVARIALEGSVPAGDPLPGVMSGRLYYTDGMQGSGQPVRNVIYYAETSQKADLGSADIEISIVEPWQLPGDYTQDGVLDISDAINVLQTLFLGAGAPLPCEDGSTVAPANRMLLDSNGDGAIDIADAIHVLSFLFLGTAPPVLGTDCVPIVGCPAVCS